MHLSLIRADITNLEVDAIVNAANNHLWMGAGVGGAIKKSGGAAIEKEAVKKGPVPLGEAVVTSAGNLKAKHVIHAVVMGQDLATSEDYIRTATRNAIRLADEMNLKSIAFPALGTGVGGFSFSDCARIMVDEVRRFSAKNLQQIIFCVFGDEAYKAFYKEINASGR